MENFFKIEPDIFRNRLYITLKGTIRQYELGLLYTDIRFGVADLRPGFQVVSDLSQARYGYLDGVITFLKIAHFLKEKKAGMIIRIVNKPQILLTQLRSITAMIENYEPIYVSSLEEAEEILITSKLETA
jgi:hypothetical protein